jgi:Fe-S cluster biogenesis protein NfuA
MAGGQIDAQERYAQEHHAKERDVLERIESVLDEKIRPYLRTHGGDVEIQSLADGVLRVKMLGGCGNCPSAVFEMEQMVAEVLTDAVQDVRSVSVVTGVSASLLAEARAILNREPLGTSPSREPPAIRRP